MLAHGGSASVSLRTATFWASRDKSRLRPPRRRWVVPGDRSLARGSVSGSPLSGILLLLLLLLLGALQILGSLFQKCGPIARQSELILHLRH
jgi:hypothetical protein